MTRAGTPVEMLELNGAFKHNPARRRSPGPKSKSDFSLAAPRHFSPEEKEVWNELVPAAPAGVLTALDRPTVEVVCRLMAKFRGTLEKPGWLNGAEFGALGTALGKLGWTPVDRSKVIMTKSDDKAQEFDFLQ